MVAARWKSCHKGLLRAAEAERFGTLIETSAPNPPRVDAKTEAHGDCIALRIIFHIAVDTRRPSCLSNGILHAHILNLSK